MEHRPFNPSLSVIKYLGNEIHRFCMKPPTVPSDFVIPDLPKFVDRFNHVYKIIKNLYGLKDSGRTLHEFLQACLLDRNWK